MRGVPDTQSPSSSSSSRPPLAGGVGGAVASTKKSGRHSRNKQLILKHAHVIHGNDVGRGALADRSSSSTTRPGRRAMISLSRATRGPTSRGRRRRSSPATGGANTGRDFDFDVQSYIWVPNIGNCCCVNFCANSTSRATLGIMAPL
ncbi:hypothetical protein J3459_006557 [Metarhizium acridum]|nr:hypothetical protein J3459_006557 [Metarhizium acridum]